MIRQRPPKKEPIRSYHLGVRLNPSEHERINAAAQRLNISPATFVRRAALNSKTPPPIPELNRAAWAELARLSANINQQTAKINTGFATSAMSPEQFKELRSTVESLRLALIGAPRNES